jgi:hypothetical protein
MTQTFTRLGFVAMIIVALLTTLFYAVTPVPSAIKNTANDLTTDAEYIALETSLYATVSLPVGQLVSHATEKHGDAAIRAEECAARPDLTLYRSDDGHFVDICKTSAGLFGIFVYVIENNMKMERTALEKEKMNRLGQVIKNLINGHYSPDLPFGTPGIIIP